MAFDCARIIVEEYKPKINSRTSVQNRETEFIVRPAARWHTKKGLTDLGSVLLLCSLWYAAKMIFNLAPALNPLEEAES